MSLRGAEVKLVHGNEMRSAVIGALYLIFDDIYTLLEITRLNRPHELVRLLLAARELIAMVYQVDELADHEVQTPDLPSHDADLKAVLKIIHDDILTDLYGYMKDGSKLDPDHLWRPCFQSDSEEALLILALIAIDQLFLFADLDTIRRHWHNLRRKPSYELLQALESIRGARATMRPDHDTNLRLAILRAHEMLLTVLSERGFSPRVIDACSHSTT